MGKSQLSVSALADVVNLNATFCQSDFDFQAVNTLSRRNMYPCSDKLDLVDKVLFGISQDRCEKVPEFVWDANLVAESSLEMAASILQIVHKNFLNKFSTYPPNTSDFGWGQSISSHLREAIKCVDDAERRLFCLRRAHEHLKNYDLARTRVESLARRNTSVAEAKGAFSQPTIADYFPKVGRKPTVKCQVGKRPKTPLPPQKSFPAFSEPETFAKSVNVKRQMTFDENSACRSSFPVTSTKRESPSVGKLAKSTTFCDASPIYPQGICQDSPQNGTYVKSDGVKAVSPDSTATELPDFTVLADDSVFHAKSDAVVTEAEIALLEPHMSQPTLDLTPAQQRLPVDGSEGLDTVDLAPMVFHHQGFEIFQDRDPYDSPDEGVVRVDMPGVPGTWFRTGNQVVRETPSPLLKQCHCARYKRTAWCAHREAALEKFRQANGIPKWEESAAKSVASAPAAITIQRDL